MTSYNPVQVADPEELKARCSAMLGHVGDLVERLSEALPPDRAAELGSIIEGGGRIGLEVTVDRHNVPQFVLIGIEPEGLRHVFHTVRPVQG